MGLEGALVEVYMGETLVTSGYTDENGYFATTLAAGTFDIYVSKTGYTTMHKTVTVAENEELMVNLTVPVPPALLPPAQSGIMGVFGAFENPTITETPTVKNTSDAKETLTESVVISVT